MASWMRNVKMMEQWINVRRQMKKTKEEWSAQVHQRCNYPVILQANDCLPKHAVDVTSCAIWIDHWCALLYWTLSFSEERGLVWLWIVHMVKVNVTCTAAGLRTVCQNADLQESAYFQGTCLLMCVYSWMNTLACVKYIHVIACTSCFLCFFS